MLFIAVGTPSDEDGSADLKYVLSVGDAVVRHRFEPLILVEKSTVPVGRALEFDIVSNPEFLKEGSAVEDCRRPDRIIIGCEREEVREVMRDLYAPFNRNHDRIMFMDLRSAELTKYAAKIGRAYLGADIEAVRMGIGADQRIGYHFIYPGCGYGGSCFPKDMRALIHSAQQANCPASQLLQRPAASGGSDQRTAETQAVRPYQRLLQGRPQGQDLRPLGDRKSVMR